MLSALRSRYLSRTLLLLALGLVAVLAAACSDGTETTTTTASAGAPETTGAGVATTEGQAPGTSGTSVSGSSTTNVLAERLTELQEQVRENPKDVGALQQLAIAYYQSKEYEKAVNTYRKILALEDSALTRNNLANAYRDWGKTAEAIEQYQAAIKLDPAVATSYTNLAALYMTTGELDKAKETLAQGAENVAGDAKQQLQRMLESLG